MEASRTRPRRGRRLALGVVAVLALALLAVGLAWSRREALAGRWLEGRFAALGIAPVTLRVTDFGPGGLTVRDLALGEAPDAEVAAVQVAWSLRGLLAGRFERLSVRGVRVRGALGEQGLELGALDPALQGEGEGGPFVLPAPRLEIADARATLETPAGRAELGLAGALEETAPGRLEGRFDLDAAHPWGAVHAELVLTGRLDDLEGHFALAPELAAGSPLRLDPGLRAEATLHWGDDGLTARATVPRTGFAWHGTGPVLEGETPRIDLEARLPAGGERALVLDLDGGRTRLPALGVVAEGLALRLRVQGSALEGQGTLRELRDTATPARFAPLRAEVRLEGPPEAVSAEARVADASGALSLRASARGDLGARTGTADVRLEPLVFAPGGIQPASLSPMLAGRIGEASGTLEATARVALDEKGPQVVGDLALRDLSFTADAAQVTGLSGAVRLEGPAPWHTPPDQLVSVALVDVGLPLVDGLLRFQLRPDGVLSVAAAEWHWADGRLAAAADVPLDASAFEATLEVEDLDVARIVEHLALDGLSGSGRLSGRVPLRVEASQVAVRGARLESGPAGGVLRYQPETSVEAMAQRQASTLGFALDALRDFRYEELWLLLDGDARGEMEVGIHLRGRNPNFQGGRPVELNMNLDAHLADLVEAGLATYRVPEAIERRLREFTEERNRP